MDEPLGASSILDDVMDQPSASPTGQQAMTAWDIALQMLHETPGPIAMEETFLETMRTTAGRGVFQTMRQMGGFRQAGAGVVESVIGENFLSHILSEKGKLEQFVGELGLKMLPRDRESEGAIERLLGNVLESGPSTALPIVAGIAAGPLAGPVVAFTIFAGSAAAPVVGGQYLEALAAGRSDEEAQVEALIAGMVTFATQLIPFQTIFGKIPGADRLVNTAARRVAFRLIGGGIGESAQEILEGLGIETAKAILRHDPEIAFGMLTDEFWGPLLEEAVTAALVGSAFSGSIQFRQEYQARRAEGKAITLEEMRIAHQAILLMLPDVTQAPGQVSRGVDVVGEPVQPGLPETITLIQATQIPKIKLTKAQSAEIDATATGTLKRFGIDAGGGAVPVGSMNTLTQEQREELAGQLEQDNDPVDGLEGRSGPLRRSMATLIEKLREGAPGVEGEVAPEAPAAPAAPVAPEPAAEAAVEVRSEVASIDAPLLPDAQEEAVLIRSGPLGDDARRNSDVVLGEVQRRLDDQATAAEAKRAEAKKPKPTRPKQKESVQDLIRRIVWGGPYRVETVTEAEELLKEIRELKKLGREAIRKARAEGVDDATRVWEARLERAKNRAGEVDALKDELLEALTERFKGALPQNLAKKLNKVRTRKQLDNAIAIAERSVQRLERREAIDRVKNALRSARTGRLAPDIQEAVDELLSGVNIVNLSDPLRDLLTRIRIATEGVGLPPVVTAAQLAAVRDFIIANQGVTYEPFEGVFEDSGYVVSRYPKREQALPPGVLITTEMIAAYLKKNADVFANNPRARLGGWYDKATRQWVLDIAEIHENSDVGKQEALDVARTAAQKAIFHLDSLTTTFVFKSDAEWRAARRAADLAPPSDVAADSRQDEPDRAGQRRDVVLPKRLEDELKRLDRTNVGELETSDIQHLAEMLEGLLGVNGRRFAARRGALAQSEDRGSEVMASEIDGRIRPGPGAVVPTQRGSRRTRPLRVSDQGRQEIDDPGKLGGLVEIAVGRIPNMLAATLAEYLGGRLSGTYQILYGDVDRGMDRAYALEFQFIDMWESELRALGAGDEVLRRMSSRIATARNVFLKMAQALGVQVSGATSADIITYKLSNNQTLQMDRDERMYLLNLLRRRIVFEDIIHRGTPIKLRANPAKSITLTAADVRIIRETMPGVNSMDIDNAVAQTMFDIVNGPARRALSQWSIQYRGWDITAGEAFYWMSRREHTVEPDLTGSSFTRRTMHQLSILKPKTEGASDAYLIGSMIQEGRRYLKQVAMLTQVGPELDFAAKTLNSKRVQRVLRNLKGGKRITARFNQTYEMMAQDAGVGLPIEGPAEAAIGKIISNATLGALGLNAWVSMYQPLSLVMAGLFQSPVHLMHALATGASLDSRIDDRMKQYGYLRHRNFGSNLGLVQEGGTLGTQLLGRRDGLREQFMAMIRAFDLTAIRAIWRGAESEAGVEPQADGLLSDADLERVVEIAGPTVKMSQPTFDTLHLSWIGVVGKRAPVSKLAFGMFRAQTAKNINMYHLFAMRRQWGKLAMAMFVTSFLIALIRDLRDTVARRKKPKDPAHIRLLRGTGSAILGQAVFGDWLVLASDIALGFRGYEPSNVASGMAMDMFSAVRRFRASWIKNGFDSEETQRALVEFVIAAATFSGLPVRSLFKDLSPWFWPKPPESKKRKGFP